MKTTRILLADDHEIIRRGLRAILETDETFEIAGEAVDGQDAIEKAARLKPDVVVLDISMPGVDGFEATRRIVRDTPNIKVLVLTVHDSDTVATRTLQAGARGYVLKSDAGSELLVALDFVRQGTPCFTSRVAGLVLRGFRRDMVAAKSDAYS